MAKQTWDYPINKHTDWGGDASTTNLPVCGARVQEFIKNTFEGKVGCIYYDTTHNRYLMFADTETRDQYLSDPTTYASLLLGTFDAPFNYTASITLVDTNINNYVQFGSTGNYIKAQFNTVNKSGTDVAENYSVTVTFRNGSSTTTISRQVAYDTLFSLNIDNYLLEGQNSITLQIVGNDTLAATSQAIIFYAMKLELVDYFNVSSQYGINDTIEVDFEVKGNGIKHMVWYLDGVLQEHDSQVDDITASESPILTRYIQLDNAAYGRHNLQFRAYIQANDGSNFYSETHYRDFTVTGATNQKNLVAGFNYPTTDGGAVIDTTLTSITINGLAQFEPTNLIYGIYDSAARTDNVATITFEGKSSSYNVLNLHDYTYVIQPTISGNTTLTISMSGATSIVFNGSVAASNYDLHEVSNCIFRFNGTDRTNNSEDRDSWTYGNYSATFSGFTWNESNGWVGDGFLIGAGQELSINYAPLQNVSTQNGATIEFKFDTEHVNDENQVIANMATSGVGIVITASECSITSTGGVSVSTKYKSGEDVRISFVINRYSAGNNKGLVFIYVNGILSGALPYGSGDSFVSSSIIDFIGTDNAYIKLKQILAYSRPLTSNEILNNYILYQDTFDGLIDTYNSNDVYTEDTENLSIDKVTAKMPVIIVTGNLEELQNTTDKNKEVLMEKIEIINMDDPTRNLTLTNAIMRPQGTSSMSYPKKNFRIYSKRGANTKMYDYQGNEVADRLYAFKAGAQRVKVWCLKADYAESSSSHNTGVARLWNDVLKNANISSVDERNYISGTPYVCRTIAQATAIANNFSGDVRTTIDGFPICLFYHLHENDPLIFVGKYNFNNDKSTESVYGFVGIPDFDNSHVECWEVTNNGSTLALFTNVSDFDNRFRECFEARYPDDADSPEEAERAKGALKTFVTWVNSVSGSTENFSDEKWNHIDVYKMAAYYVYAMRFGAVDQIVKNAMLTTEDGVHWFYINYDNDTILGLRNDGLLKFGPTITRQSLDPSDPTSYCYAGHDSVLWNMFEADEEFMAIVKQVDKSLYNAGLTYGNMIDMFNNKQSGKWGERLFNIDEQYKYLDVWNTTQNNQLEKLQGSRESHREWWISKRFGMYDEMNLIGSYVDNNVEIKPTSYGVTGATVSIRPASNGHYYGYGINNDPIESGVSGTTDADITFVTPADRPLYIGDPVRFYNARNMAKFDASLMQPYIQEATFSNIRSNGEDSMLNTVILGSSANTNSTLTQLGSISYVKFLKKLDIQNYNGLTSLNLSQNKYLEELNANGCAGLTSLELPEAAPITTLVLPSSLHSLNLVDLHNLETLELGNSGISLSTINIMGCGDYTASEEFETFFTNWIENHTANAGDISINIDGLDIDMSYTDAYYLGVLTTSGASINLSGVINIDSALTFEQMSVLQEFFGSNCFNPESSFHFTFTIVDISNLSISLSKSALGRNDSLVASISFEGNNFSNGEFTLSYNSGITLYQDSFNATATTGDYVAETSVTITYTLTKISGVPLTISATFETMPYVFYINGELLSDNYNINIEYNTGDTAVTITDGWVITESSPSTEFSISAVTISGGTAVFSGHTIESITKTALNDTTAYDCSIVLNVDGQNKTFGFTITTLAIGPSFQLIYDVNDTANPTQLMNSAFTISRVSSLKIDGSAVTPSLSYLFTSTGAHNVVVNCRAGFNLSNIFNSCDRIVSAMTFNNMTSIPEGAFSGCTNLNFVYLPNTIANLGANVFTSCLYLQNIVIDRAIAPTISANTFGSGTATAGYSTTGPNTLYLPQGYSNYGGDNWINYLLDCTTPYGRFMINAYYEYIGNSVISATYGVGSTTIQLEEKLPFTVSSVTASINNENFTASTPVATTYSIVPNGYTELQWVRGNGNSHFDLPFNVKFKYGNAGCDVWFAFEDDAYTSGITQTLFGVWNSSNYTEFRLYKTISDDKRVVFGLGAGTASANTVYYNWDNNDLQHCSYIDAVITGTNNRKKTQTPGGQGSARSYIAIGSCVTASSGAYDNPRLSHYHLGRLKFYHSTTLDFDLVPVKRNLDGLAGFYDIKNNVFYYSTASEDFEAGPVAPDHIIYNIDLNVSGISASTYANLTNEIKYLNNVSASPTKQILAEYFEPFKPMIIHNVGNSNGTVSIVATGSAPALDALYAVVDDYTGDIDNYNYDGDYSAITGATSINVPSGNSLLLLSQTMTQWGSSAQNYNSIVTSGSSFEVDGSVYALTKNEVNTGKTYNYFALFKGANISKAPTMSASTLTASIYCAMFSGCTSLTSAPELPATTLTSNCYNQMFAGCTSLVSATTLPSTTLASYCYYGMFKNCVSLTAAPTIRSTSEFEGSYYQEMFLNCSSLTSIIIEKNQTVYQNLAGVNMFKGCEKLNSITINDTIAPNITDTTFGTGTDTAGYNSGTSNVLYTKTGATGYDGTYWTSNLLNENYGKFTVSYTL